MRGSGESVFDILQVSIADHLVIIESSTLLATKTKSVRESLHDKASFAYCTFLLPLISWCPGTQINSTWVGQWLYVIIMTFWLSHARFQCLKWGKAIDICISIVEGQRENGFSYILPENFEVTWKIAKCPDYKKIYQNRCQVA